MLAAVTARVKLQPGLLRTDTVYTEAVASPWWNGYSYVIENIRLLKLLNLTRSKVTLLISLRRLL